MKYSLMKHFNHSNHVSDCVVYDSMLQLREPHREIKALLCQNLTLVNILGLRNLWDSKDTHGWSEYA